jgi:hypothetical protein
MTGSVTSIGNLSQILAVAVSHVGIAVASIGQAKSMRCKEARQAPVDCG